MSGTESATPVPPARPAAHDASRAWTLARSDEGTTRTIRGVDVEPAAVGRGSSVDLLAWLHGRPMVAPLTMEGDHALLEAWNLLQRTEF